MDERMQERRKGNFAGKEAGSHPGVITVFFSLILLLIITLLTTMAETARVAACTRMAELFMEVGAKSLLGSYDLPLYENYHVFGRHCEDVREGNMGALQEEFAWYLKENMGGDTFISMHPQNAALLQISALTDRNGSLFYEQALQYAKYQDAGLLLEWALQSAGKMKQSEETGVVVQKKYEADSMAASAEDTLAQLVGLVDGFCIEDGALALDWRGKIKTTGSFAKKMVPGNPSQERLLPNHPVLYEAQEKNYYDPVAALNSILIYRQLSEEEKVVLERLYCEEKELKEEYERAASENLENMDHLKKQLARKQAEIQDHEEAAAQAMLNCNDGLLTFRARLLETKQSAEAAFRMMEELKKKKQDAVEGLLKFEEELKDYQGKIPEELWEEMHQENQELLKEYEEENAMGILKDMDKMADALAWNIGILNQALSNVPMPTQESKEALSLWEGRILGLRALMEGLAPERLLFSYDNIRIPEKGMQKGYRSLLKELSEYGFAGLILENPREASQAVLDDAQRPSLGYLDEFEEKREFSLSDLLNWNRQAPFFPDCEGLQKLLETGAKELLEQLLYLTYLSKHFTNYADLSKDSEKESDSSLAGLQYQLEYIISGKTSDWKNLSSIIARIYAIRFAVSLGTILCSKECRAQAKGAAAAMVGFTGVGALVAMMQFVIELLWAAECAAVETAALFLGGEIAFFASGRDLPVKFHELLTCSKSVLMGKAKAIGKEEKGGILKSYSEYLFVFLLLTKKDLRTLRTMDVMQQEMQLQYYEGFRLKDCVCGVSVKAEIAIPYRFLSILGQGQSGKVSKSLSYGISY